MLRGRGYHQWRASGHACSLNNGASRCRGGCAYTEGHCARFAERNRINIRLTGTPVKKMDSPGNKPGTSHTSDESRVTGGLA